MPQWILGAIEAINTIGKFLMLIVGAFKKPLVDKEQKINEDNRKAEENAKKTGRE